MQCHAHCIKTMAPRTPWKDALSGTSVPVMFNTLYSSMNQWLFEKNLYNQSNHYENYGQFLLRIDVRNAKSTLFMVSKDEWNTKKGTGKSMKSTFNEQWCLKTYLGTKQHWTVKKIK